jgi:SAM-dependent methyltransferase
MCRGFPSFIPDRAGESRGDADYADDALAAAQRRHFWFVSRAELLVWAIRRYFPRLHSLLEIGCGTGGVTGAIRAGLPNARIAAGDVRLGGLERARRDVPNVEFLHIDAERLPFDAEFDAAGAFDVIEHLDDDRATLTALRDAVKPGGGVLVTVPQHPALWSAVDEFSRHRRRYTRRDLDARLRAAGLEVVRMTSFASIVLPLLLVSRRWPRRFEPERELRLSDAVNGMLLMASAVERRVIAAGCSLGAGGSLLAVARRPA